MTNKVESFAPTVIVDGKGYTPKGYHWILGFALGGCQWAIDIADTPEFKAKVIRDLKDEKIKDLEFTIKSYKSKIEGYTKEIKNLL